MPHLFKLVTITKVETACFWRNEQGKRLQWYFRKDRLPPKRHLMVLVALSAFFAILAGAPTPITSTHLGELEPSSVWNSARRAMLLKCLGQKNLLDQRSFRKLWSKKCRTDTGVYLRASDIYQRLSMSNKSVAYPQEIPLSLRHATLPDQHRHKIVKRLVGLSEPAPKDIEHLPRPDLSPRAFSRPGAMRRSPDGNLQQDINSGSPSSWRYYFKTALRKLLSVVIINASAGNQWSNFINFNSIVNASEINFPTSFSATKKLFWDMFDGEQGGDMTGFLDQLIYWAPIGPLVHRAEVDLDFNLEQVAGIFFVSPRESTKRVSTRPVNGQMPTIHSNVATSPLDSNRPITKPGPYRSPYLLTPEHSHTARYQAPSAKEGDMKLLQTSSVFRKSFQFWLSAVSYYVHPYENMSWVGIGPLKLGGKIAPSVTAYVVTFSDSKKDEIKSIMTYSLPVY